MQQHVEAENALEGLNNSLLRGRPIRVGWARRNSSCLYIEGLCPSVTAEDLNTAFAPFGELKQSKTTVTPSESSDMNNGTVHFTFRDSAMLAKGRMNGQVLGELPIVVEWGQLPSSSDRYGGGGGGGGGGCYGRNNNGHGFHSKIYNGHGHGHGHGHGFMERGAVDQDLYTTYEELGPAAPAVSLYVNFHTVAPGIDITEEVAATQPPSFLPSFPCLQHTTHSFPPPNPLAHALARSSAQVIFSLFAQFTSPVSVHIKSCTVDMASPGHQRGYAFVHFASSDVGREQAMHVVKTARDVVLDGVHLTSELSKNFRRGMAPGSYPCQKKEQQQHYRQEQQHLHQQQYAMFPQQSHMQMGGRSGMSPRMTGMNAMYAQPQYYVAPSMGMGADMAYGAAGYYHEMDASLAPQMAFDFSGVQSSMAYPYPTGPAYHYQQRGSGNGNGGNGGNGGSGGGGGGGGGNLPSKGGAATAYPEGTHGGGGGGGGSGSGNGHGGSITVQLAPPP